MKEHKSWTKEQVTQMAGSGDEVTGKVLPVNQEIKAEQKILNFWFVEELLRKSERIAVGECDCRKTMGNCDNTLDGCLFLNSWADNAIEKGYAKEATFDEALSILKRTYKEGLVLTAGCEDPPVKICSCCSCCCFMFAGIQQYDMDYALVHSDYIAHVHKDECSECRACVDRCHFGAMQEVDFAVAYEPEKCYGCGLCIATCPSDAIELIAR
jgi:NAD-dependent dihydropyrimidine dehydrogenase PreA subunit